jgi:hypothetical protein
MPAAHGKCADEVFGQQSRRQKKRPMERALGGQTGFGMTRKGRGVNPVCNHIPTSEETVFGVRKNLAVL